MGAPRHSLGHWNSIGWIPLVAIPGAVVVLTPPEWPRWAFMWLLALGVFAGFKWLTWWCRPRPFAPAWKHFAYLFGWVGLDAAAFLNGAELPPKLRPKAREWVGAATNTLLGSAIIWILVPQLPIESDLARGWVGMIGLILMLHFGIFDLLSCVWRRVGIRALPLMNHPLRATSLADFWGNRWNTAFRDITHRFLFRPLARRAGATTAMLAGFLLSGLLHDLVISVPAGKGYGGPTLYFLVQAAGLSVARSKIGGVLRLDQGPMGWLYTAVVVGGPAFLLFHPPFVRTVIVPFLGFLDVESCC